MARERRDADIEQRLAEAAAAVRERELLGQRCDELRARLRQLEAQIAELRTQHAAELADVQRLEGLTLTRVLASLRGAREDRLAREHGEAMAAGYRLRQAEANLAALGREHFEARLARGRLAGAGKSYAALLEEKERWLAESGHPLGTRLLDLAEERGRLRAELPELKQALRAARGARDALDRLQQQLDSASEWSTFDTFLGGGLIASAYKHDRLEQAGQAARQADRCLALLRTELADVDGESLDAPELWLSGTLRLFDVWFDNLIADLMVRGEIRRASRDADRVGPWVRKVYSRLKRRTVAAEARLNEIDAERRAILTV